MTVAVAVHWPCIGCAVQSLHNDMPSADLLAPFRTGSARAFRRYRAGWEPAAPSGRRVLRVSWVSSGLVGTIYTQSNLGFMKPPYFEKLADFSYVHVIMWWIGPMWPKCAFGDQKGLIRKNRHAVWHSPLIMQNVCGLLKQSIFFLFLQVKRRCFRSKSGVSGCFGPNAR